MHPLARDIRRTLGDLMSRKPNLRRRRLFAASFFTFVLFSNCSAAFAQSQETEGELIANLAGGRVIVHVTKDDVIIFGAIDQPLEAGGIPPRVMQADGAHIGILMGASEWRSPADPKPIRLDKESTPPRNLDIESPCHEYHTGKPRRDGEYPDPAPEEVAANRCQDGI